MNPAIRDWIHTNHQPWRASLGKSLFHGVLGSEGALPLDVATQEYFFRRGIGTDGRIFEDLLEADLLGVAEKIASWMPEEERKKFDRAVAFGVADTLEPNACAMTCLDGYAILFDLGFHALLAQAIELQLAVMQKMIRPDELPLILNLAIATTFFHVADPMEYIARKPKVTTFQRQASHRVLWFGSLFFLGHEAGHVVLNHLEDAPKRGVTFRSNPSLTTAEVLEPAHLEEFAADWYSIKLLFEGEERGELRTGDSDQAQYWSSSYVNLGWMFSILEAVERMSERLGIKLSDTHPPAAHRWERIAGALREHSPIPDSAIRLEGRLRAAAIEAAESGELPEIRKDWPKAREKFVAYPSALLADLLTTSPQPAREVLEAWFSSQTPAAAMEVLRGHPEMLSAEVKEMHYERAKAESDEFARRDILVNKLLVLHQCLETGIKKAFDEYEAGKLGVRSKPLPVYDACDSVEVAVLAKVEEAVKKLVDANNADQTEAVLESYPELQHPAADLFLVEFASDQPNESARKRVAAARIILAGSKRFTVFRAVLEARARLRY